MSDPAPPPTVALPGWYPDAGGVPRWWTGSAWSEHAVPPPFAVPLRRRPRRLVRILGVALLCLALASPMLAGLALMGDPYPISRAGIAEQADDVSIVNAVCPGERLTAITVRVLDGAGSSTVVWQLHGDVPLPASVTLGGTVPGMRTVIPLSEPIARDAQVSLWVVTSELTGPYAMDVRLEQIPPDGVFAYGESYSTVADFAAASVERTPCGDPYSKRGVERFALIVIALGGLAAVSGSVLLVIARRARRVRDA